MAGDYWFERIYDRWSETGSASAVSVGVDRAAPGAGKKSVISGFQASGDAAALVTVESPAGTVLYQKRFAAAFTVSEAFAPGTMIGAENAAVRVKVSTCTDDCEANSQGYTVRGR